MTRCIAVVCVFVVSKEIGSEQIPKSTIAALGKMAGSEGNHCQTARHRQCLCCVFVVWDHRQLAILPQACLELINNHDLGYIV